MTYRNTGALAAVGDPHRRDRADGVPSGLPRRAGGPCGRVASPGRAPSPLDDDYDNVFWQAFSGVQADLTVGSSTARRYAPGYSPIVAFADPREPDFAALAGCCDPAERLYWPDAKGPLPAGWRLLAEAPMRRMVWPAGRVPEDDDEPDAVALGPRHAAQAVDLAMLTRPGPFGPRTIELGDYVGVFRDGRLVAMAGERIATGTVREISGVCTHPDFQGLGLARRLVSMLLRRELERGETPILHVLQDNESAHRLYRRMGFEVHATVPVRVIAPDAAA